MLLLQPHSKEDKAGMAMLSSGRRQRIQRPNITTDKEHSSPILQQTKDTAALYYYRQRIQQPYITTDK